VRSSYQRAYSSYSFRVGRVGAFKDVLITSLFRITINYSRKMNLYLQDLQPVRVPPTLQESREGGHPHGSGKAPSRVVNIYTPIVYSFYYDYNYNTN
jgi:hypothetical protein